MDQLINYLLEFGPLNPQQITLIKRLVVSIELKKGAYFSEAGQTARRVAIVQEGVLRVCYYTNRGNEVTRYFVDENNFAVDLTSFNHQIPSAEYIQAVTDCQLVVFSQLALQELSAVVIGWDEIIHRITAKALLEKVNRVNPMIAENATQRYLSFMKRFPALANRIPLSDLASYLGITQSSLSRIRKNITG